MLELCCQRAEVGGKMEGAAACLLAWRHSACCLASPLSSASTQVLELGCGWGSWSLYMAEKFPGSTITAISNSRTQRAFITTEAQ